MSGSFEIRETLTLETGAPPSATPVFLVGPCSSSIDVAWELIERSELPVWGAVLVESQTGGRGRMGRVWQSPPGHVYGAMRLPLAPPFDGPAASLALALILAEAFKGGEQFGSNPAECSEHHSRDGVVPLRGFGWDMMIKWPNDLIFEGGKVGGLLLESRKDNLVAGIGFNLMSPPDGDWMRERDAGAPPPSALPFADGPAALWPALVKRFILLYKEKFRGRTMADLIQEAEKRMFWMGRTVVVERPSSTPPAPETGLVGRIIGLGQDGHLRLANADGEYSLWSGTVFLRPD